MTDRHRLAGGALIAMLGVALVPPVLVARAEHGGFTPLGAAIIAMGGVLIACGASVVLAGWRQRRGPDMPTGVRAAVAVTVLFLAFFSLEFSDGLVRQDGRVFYWTTVLFAPVLLLLWGLLAARRWAWWIFRGATALGTLWFVAFTGMIPFANLHSGGVPVPWQGRVYMLCVSVAFAGTLAGAFWSLGRREARDYFVTNAGRQ
jgi:hypothetical protein